MFEELVGKRVRVVQKDGFVKYGLLTKLDANFLMLEYVDKTLHAVAMNQIASCDQENLERVDR